MKKKYRIVRDNYLGYEVQYKVWYWPFWIQCSGGYDYSANTHSSIKEAKEFAKKQAQPPIYL